MSLLDSGSFSRYFIYAFSEIGLVVIGILIALRKIFNSGFRIPPNPSDNTIQELISTGKLGLIQNLVENREKLEPIINAELGYTGLQRYSFGDLEKRAQELMEQLEKELNSIRKK